MKFSATLADDYVTHVSSCSNLAKKKRIANLEEHWLMWASKHHFFLDGIHVAQARFFFFAWLSCKCNRSLQKSNWDSADACCPQFTDGRWPLTFLERSISNQITFDLLLPSAQEKCHDCLPKTPPSFLSRYANHQKPIPIWMFWTEFWQIQLFPIQMNDKRFLRTDWEAWSRKPANCEVNKVVVDLHRYQRRRQLVASKFLPCLCVCCEGINALWSATRHR